MCLFLFFSALSLLVLPFTLASVFSTGWMFNDTWCKIQGYLFTVCQVSIQFSLMVISVDRYYAIINSLRYPYIFTQRLGHILIASAWILSFIIGVPPLAGFGQYNYDLNKYTCSLNEFVSKFYLVFLSASAFLIPLVLQAWCYLSIFRAAIGHTKRRSKVYPSMPSTIRDPPSDSSDNSEVYQSVQVQYRSMECKAVRTILLIAVAYAICWVPCFVCSLSILTGNFVPNSAHSAAVCFVFLSGIVNPVIYAFMNRITRYEINKFFCDAVSRVSSKTTTLNDSEDYFSTTATTNYSSKNSNRLRNGSKAASSSKGIEMNTIREEIETEEISKIPEETEIHYTKTENDSQKSEENNPVKEIILEPSALYIHRTQRKKSIIKVLPIHDVDGSSKSKWTDIEELDKHWDACVSYTSDKVRGQRKTRANSEFLSRSDYFLRKKDCGSFLYFDRQRTKHNFRYRDTKMKRRGRLSLDIDEANAISKHVPSLQSILENEFDMRTEIVSSSNHNVKVSNQEFSHSQLNDFPNTPDLSTPNRNHMRKHRFCINDLTGSASNFDDDVDAKHGRLKNERRCFSA